MLAMVPIVSGATEAAGEEALSPTAGRPNCGDYSILETHPVRALLEKHCGMFDETNQKALLGALARLDPAAEARAAARRGDFRLAAVIWGGPPPPGPRRALWIQGGDCKAVEDHNAVIWLYATDVYRNATDSQVDGQMSSFAERYNAVLMREPGFPAALGCEPK